jgi:hypothetical protein
MVGLWPCERAPTTAGPPRTRGIANMPAASGRRKAVCRRTDWRSPYTRGYAQRRRSQTDTAGVYGGHLSRGGEERWLKRRDPRQELAGHVSGEA